MLGGEWRKGVEARQIGACVTVFGPIPVLGLSNKVDFGLLMHMLIVTGEIAGCGCGWWTHRAHRIGARADRCLAHSGRHFGSICSPQNPFSKHPVWGHTRRKRIDMHSHVRAVTCTGGGLLARDTRPNLIAKGCPSRATFVCSTWSWSMLILSMLEGDGTDRDL